MGAFPHDGMSVQEYYSESGRDVHSKLSWEVGLNGQLDCFSQMACNQLGSATDYIPSWIIPFWDRIFWKKAAKQLLPLKVT